MKRFLAFAALCGGLAIQTQAHATQIRSSDGTPMDVTWPGCPAPAGQTDANGKAIPQGAPVPCGLYGTTYTGPASGTGSSGTSNVPTATQNNASANRVPVQDGATGTSLALDSTLSGYVSTFSALFGQPAAGQQAATVGYGIALRLGNALISSTNRLPVGLGSEVYLGTAVPSGSPALAIQDAATGGPLLTLGGFQAAAGTSGAAGYGLTVRPLASATWATQDADDIVSVPDGAQKAGFVGGIYRSAVPTLTNGQFAGFALDAAGRLMTVTGSGMTAATASYVQPTALPSDPAPTTSTATANGQIVAPFLVSAGYQSAHYFAVLPPGATIQVQECRTATVSSCTATSALVHAPSGVSAVQASISGGASGSSTGFDVPRGSAPYQRVVVTVYSSGTVSVDSNPSYVAVAAPGSISEPTLESVTGTTADSPATNGTGIWTIPSLLKGQYQISAAALGTPNDAAAASGSIEAMLRYGQLASRVNDIVNSAAAPRYQTHDDGIAQSVRANDVVGTNRLQTHNDALVAGTANIGRTSLPSAAGLAPAATTTAASSTTATTLFTAGTIANGCFVQPYPANAVALIVDWGGGTPASPISPQSIAAGVTVPCAAAYTNAVTMWPVSGTTALSVYAGRF